MGAFLGPLLLVLVGVGGLVVVFGRRVKEIRATSAEVPGLSFRLHAPSAPVSVRVLSGRVLRTLGTVVVGVFRGARVVGRGIARILQRPPIALRVPRLAGPMVRRFRAGAPAAPVSPRVVVRGDDTVEEKLSAPAVEKQAPATPPDRVQIPERRAEEVSLGWSARELETLTGTSAVAEAQKGTEEPVPHALERPDTGEVEFVPREIGAPERLGSSEELLPVEPPSVRTAPAEVPARSSGRPLLSAASRAGVKRGSFPVSEELPAESVASSKDLGEIPALPILDARVTEETATRRKVVGRVRPTGGKAGRKAGKPRDRGAVTDESREQVLLPGTLEEVPGLLKKGEFARAESILIDRLAEDPRNTNAYRLLGQLYIQREDFAQAKEVLEEALRRNPNEAFLFGPMGRTYFGLGQYGKALQMYQLAHDADEANLEYLERLLLIASRMDRRPLVRVTAEKILAVQPNHAEAKKHLARAAA